MRFILTSRPSASEGAIRDVLTRTALPNIAFMEPWQLRTSDQEVAGAAADGGDAAGGETKAGGEGAAPAPPPNADRVMLFDALVSCKCRARSGIRVAEGAAAGPGGPGVSVQYRLLRVHDCSTILGGRRVDTGLRCVRESADGGCAVKCLVVGDLDQTAY